MSNRLPTPGADDNDWGQILNDYLTVSHNADGTLKLSALPLDADATLASDSDSLIATQKAVKTYVDSTLFAGSPVSSVFGRVGAVTAQSGDYNANQVGALSATDDLSAIATTNPTSGNVSLNGNKLTNLATGTSSSDAANVGQVPTIGAAGAGAGVALSSTDPTTVNSRTPNGAAAGDLSGIYPSPTVIATHLSSPLPIGQGGTGSASQTFVDLSTPQTIAGIKTFSGEVIVPTPTNSTDAVTKAYADSVAQGLSVKNSVVVLGTSNITLSGLQTIDSVALSAGNRVLLTGQSDTTQNGIWAAQSGSWTRPSDFGDGTAQEGTYSFVESGSVYASSGWVMTGGAPVIVDSDPEVWTQFSGAGQITAGSGITKTGNTLSLTSPVAVSLGGSGASSLAGLLVGNGNSPFTTKTVPTGVVVGTTDTQTLSNKTVDGNSNTLTNIPESAITNLLTDLNNLAPLASPSLSGIPTAPTATSGTDTTQLATTAFVQSAVTSGAAAPATMSSEGILQLSGDLGGTASSPTIKRTVTVTVATTASGYLADYYTTGSADDVQIQAAINAVSTAGSGTVLIREGTYRIKTSVVMKSFVNLVGQGTQRTVFRYDPTATATNFINSNNGNAYTNMEIAGITFDAEDLADKGCVQYGQVQDLKIHDCEFVNMSYNSSSKWALRIGIVNDSNIDGSASFNVWIHHNRFVNNNCGTFEVVLLPNVRQSWMHHNFFSGNSNTGTDEVSLYYANDDFQYTNNIHENWANGAVGAKHCAQVTIASNTFSNTGTTAAQAVRFNNTINGAVRNNIINVGSGSTTGGIGLFDTNVGPDGHAQRNANSYNLDLSDNILVNAYYGIYNFTGSANANYAYSSFTIADNKFYNCSKSPIRFGPNSTTYTLSISDIHVLRNVIYSWSGNIEGAISFYGNSTAPTGISALYIENNYVANNTTGASSGGVRLSAAQAATVINNYLTSSGSYGAISTPNSGSVSLEYGNVGASNPYSVSQGGTSLTSVTPYAVLAGGTVSTGALQQVSGVGSSGQVLTSAGAGALPTWQTPSASGPSVETLTDAATVTPTSSHTGGKLLTLSQAALFANPTGTPVSFQQYILRITSASSWGLSWDTKYRASSNLSLPSATTGSGKTDYLGFQWNSDSSTWDLIALLQGF